MGTAINAICKNCGFKKNWMEIGVGLIRRTPAIPALKVDTQELVLEEFTLDSNLRFYHQPDMYKGIFKKWGDADSELDEGVIQGYGIQCGDIYLSPYQNLCPQCRKFTMDFVEVGDWD